MEAHRAWVFYHPKRSGLRSTSYEVWTCSPLTGDKKECLLSGGSKREAQKIQRAYNRGLGPR